MKHDSVYCYPGTDVLINKLNIRQNRRLFIQESKLTYMRMLELQLSPLPGNFDYDHLKAIHKYFFQDVYDWAGEPRTVNISKGDSLFCCPENLDYYANESVFKHFSSDCHAAKDHASFVHVLAEHYGDLNALHAFREGNGRTQREFARELCLDYGYELDLRNTTHQMMLDASYLSFQTGDNSKLEKIFSEAVTNKKDYVKRRDRVHQLQILSIDDIPKELEDDDIFANK